MIESVFWKAELRNQARTIETRQRCCRWSEKQVVMLEREIMIAFLCIRSLIERHKLHHSIAERPLLVRAFPIKKGRQVHLLNRGDLAELYLRRSVKVKITLGFLCNQVIHSYVIFAQRDTAQKKFTTLLVCSDFERNRRLFYLKIADILLIIRAVASSALANFSYEYDEKLKDFRVFLTPDRLSKSG